MWINLLYFQCSCKRYVVSTLWIILSTHSFLLNVGSISTALLIAFFSNWQIVSIWERKSIKPLKNQNIFSMYRNISAITFNFFLRKSKRNKDSFSYEIYLAILPGIQFLRLAEDKPSCSETQIACQNHLLPWFWFIRESNVSWLPRNEALLSHSPLICQRPHSGERNLSWS